MAKYRKKPIVIDAVEYTGTEDNILELSEFGVPFVLLNDEFIITTLEDGNKGQVKHVASVGDFVIKGVSNEFYPCKPDIFAKTYEPVINPRDVPSSITGWADSDFDKKTA